MQKENTTIDQSFFSSSSFISDVTKLIETIVLPDLTHPDLN